MDTLKAISGRTSYRGTYETQPVSREDLRAIMEAGLAAPSGCNKQTTSLIAIDDPELLDEIKKLIKLPQCTSAPAFICVLTQNIVAYKGKSFSVQDYAAAIENILLATVSLGYQSCWIEGQITDEDSIGFQIAKILNVPQGYELICLLPIGKAKDPIRKARKRDFSERAWFNGFQN